MNSKPPPLRIRPLAFTYIQPSTNHLPIEVEEMCLSIFAQDAKENEPRDRVKQLGTLRLACRHFRDVLTPELFGDLTLSFYSSPKNDNHLEVFLGLVQHNPDILKHTHNVIIKFLLHAFKRETDPDARYIPVLDAISKAPITTLKIYGLNEEFPLPILYNSLDTLRCGPKLQTLMVSGTGVPAFLVCGHLGSTRLRAVEINVDSRPQHGVNADNGFDPIPFDGDSILVDEFQPFAELESLNVGNLAEFPQYFPLHDFGSSYYPSNHRIPLTLPSLSTLRLGCRDAHFPWTRCIGLKTLDYRVLGSLLSRMPKLENLFIQDDFPRSNGIDDFTPLIEELPTLTYLNYLELSNHEKEAGKQTMFTMCDIIAASLPLPALDTLSLALRWDSVHPDAIRATLYLNKCWKKLQELLLNPGLKTLRHLKLHIEIEAVYNVEYDGNREEVICPGELRALRDTLLRIYSLNGKLQVEVDINFERPDNW